jgi:hypothetical protein
VTLSLANYTRLGPAPVHFTPDLPSFSSQQTRFPSTPLTLSSLTRPSEKSSVATATEKLFQNTRKCWRCCGPSSTPFSHSIFFLLTFHKLQLELLKHDFSFHDVSASRDGKLLERRITSAFRCTLQNDSSVNVEVLLGAFHF